MADIRIVCGPAGCGKTYTAVNDFHKAVTEGDPLFGKRSCFLVVPEQLTVETEKKFFEKGAKGLIGSEVISFARLRYRILSQGDASLGDPVTGSVRSMILVKVLSAIDGRLTYFNSISGRPAAVARLSSTIEELEKYGVTPEQLEKASAKSYELHPEDDLTGGKLRELSIILTLYKEETKGFSDITAQTSKALEIINSGKSCIEDADLFFDSFSGFTDIELKLISAMAKRARSLSFYVFRDRENPVFSIPNRTFRTLSKMFPDSSVYNIAPETSAGTRFESSEMLYDISKYYADRKNSGRKYPSGEKALEIVSASDLYHELEACAKRICELTDSREDPVDYSDIAVAVPSVSDNYYVIDAVFKGFGIPCFIDARSEFSGHRIIRLFDSFLKILAGDCVIDNIVLMMKTGLYKKETYSRDDADTLENWLLKFACDKKQSFESLRRLIESTEKKYDEENLPGFLLLAKDIYGLFRNVEKGLCETAKKASCVNDVLDLISLFANICGTAFGIVSQPGSGEGGSRDDRDHIRVRNAFIDLIGECSRTIGDVRKKDFRELVRFTDDVLMSAASSIKAASIPFSGRFVQVGDIERSGYVDKKVMMVLGCNAGSFPGNIPDSSFLGDSERDMIEEIGGRTAFNSVDRALLSQFNVYKVLTCPREKLYISYSSKDENGDDRMPAAAVVTLKKMFRDVETLVYVPKGNLSGNTESYASEIKATVSPETVRKLLSKNTGRLKLNVTSLDAIGDCALKFFYRNCLDLSERDTGELMANGFGSYIHSLLENSVKSAILDGNLYSEDPAVWERYVSNAAETFRQDPKNDANVRNIDNSMRGAILSELAAASVKRELMNLAALSKAEGLSPYFLELDFGRGKSKIPPLKLKTDGGEIEISGVIDRVDGKLEDGKAILTLTDYKTPSYKIGDVISGKNMQLPVYSLALSGDDAKAALKSMLSENGIEAEETEINALRYYIYSDQSESSGTRNVHLFSGIDRENQPGLVVNRADGESDAERIVKERIGGVLAGDFPGAASEDKNNNCGSCSYKSICKVKCREDD